MIHFKKSEWLILIGLLLLSFVPSLGGIFRLVELGSGIGSEFLPENPRIQSTPAPVIFHLLSVIPYCILGAFQFLPSFRIKYPKWHRLVGRLLVSAGFIAAITGLWMTHYYSFPDDLQGVLLYIVRILIGVAMIAFLLLGLSSILKKRIEQHKAWMIRAYALGQGAGTQVLITIPWLLTIGEPMGFTRDILMSLAWGINILVGEWAIKKYAGIVSWNSIKL
jgi:uncharacterized membrane protein